MTVEKKFNLGDRVAVDREALDTLETLFPKGFDTVEGTIRWTRADVTYPGNELVDYIYTVELDQNPAIPNLQFKTSELTMVLPLAIRQLDLIIRDLDNQVAILRTYRAARVRELGL